MTEIEAVRREVPPAMIDMALAPLVVVALGRGEEERARVLVAEYDAARGDAATGLSERDFRILRAAVTTSGATELAKLIAGAQTSDYSEWTGRLAPIVDRLVAQPAIDPLQTAVQALHGKGEFKCTPPVVAQAERLEAHLAARRGEPEQAATRWVQAAGSAAECGLAFERAVIALELVEHGGGGPGEAEYASSTFARLRAAPWLRRARGLA